METKWKTYLLTQQLYQDSKSPRPRKLAHSPINTSVEEMDKFEEKEIMNKRPFTKNTWYNWLIHYIPESIKKQWVVLRKNFCFFFKKIQLEIIMKVGRCQENQKHARKK